MNHFLVGGDTVQKFALAIVSRDSSRSEKDGNHGELERTLSSSKRNLTWRWLALVVAGFACTLSASAFGAGAPKPCVTPPAGLVSWWPGDTDYNDLTGGNNAQQTAGTSLVHAEVLDGFEFAPGYSYIYVAPAKNLANQAFTWAAWVEPKGAGPNDDQFGSIIVAQDTDNTDDVIGVNWRSTPDSRFIFIFGNQDAETIYSKDQYPAGAFYHVAATYDGKTFQIYVNGTLEASYKKAKTIHYTQQEWVIGAADPNVAQLGYPRTFNGIIDEVQAFNTPLTGAQLKSIYRAGKAGECKP